MSFFKNIFDKFIGKKPEEQLPETGLASEGLDVSKTKNQSILSLEKSLSDELIDDEFLENIEEELIRSDLGVAFALDFIEKLREENVAAAKSKQALKQNQMPAKLKEFLLAAFQSSLARNKPRTVLAGNLQEKALFDENIFKLKVNNSGPNIYLIVGVNGVGKTTSIAKMANRFIKDGKRVLIAAGDTFRAAAEEQLKIWADRVGADFIELEPNAKSSAVVFKAIEKLKAEGQDVLIIDTAGRLQNKKNLMEELSKIKQVIKKNTEPGVLAETMLVLDASTGQNALSQAQVFKECCDLSSIILTKFDGSARAGMVFAIAHNLQLPVKLLGTGEGLDDIEDFNPDRFIAKYL